ncbi:MAG: tRNA (cytidine(34)-2'-O)-methyltransferase [Bacillota bacterium]|nr:tRNA (cytidine(34)-2'-O)-methyltransferase [Bacillota bacterium]
MSINIVLYQPDIPQNTGNIARTCAATKTKLILIRPLGFSIRDKYLKRAGLDYWNKLDIEYYDDIYKLIEEKGSDKFYFSTTKADKYYSDIEYPEDCYIVFGKETAGLPEKIHEKYTSQRIKIPMIRNKEARSLNLANSVNIVLYEVLRQKNFPDLY